MNSARLLYHPEGSLLPERVVPKKWESTLAVILSTSICTVVGMILTGYLDHENVIMLYMLSVVLISTRYGIAAALISCVLDVIAFAYFIVPPVLSLDLTDLHYLFTFCIMLIVTGLITKLTQSISAHLRRLSQLAELLDLTYDAITVWDLSGKIKYWNRGAERLYGLPIGNVVGKDVREVLHGTYPQPLEELIAKLLSEHAWHSEITYTADSGRQVTTESRWTLRFGADNKPDAVVEFATDIGERKLAETRVREFYSTVSHELRTPLTSIRGALALVDSGIVTADSEEGANLVSIAKASADGLSLLVDDILDLQKIEAGMLPLNIQKLAVADVVDSVIRTLKIAADAKGVQLVVKLAPSLVVQSDSVRFAQVLNNLISNAVKFSSQDGTVTIDATVVEGERLRVSVTDQGIGIPKDQFHKLFGKFQQVDQSDNRTFGGTGLGLAISKAIVEQHGGSIGVESEINVGSTFWFELPGGKSESN